MAAPKSITLHGASVAAHGFDNSGDRFNVTSACSSVILSPTEGILLPFRNIASRLARRLTRFDSHASAGCTPARIAARLYSAKHLIKARQLEINYSIRCDYSE